MVSCGGFACFRGIRSICLPLTTFVVFSLILSYVWVLYKPNYGPGLRQRISWQSWESVSLGHSPTSASQNKNQSAVGTGDSIERPDVDWWNVTQPGEQVDSSSLPLDVWSPLLPHNTGLSEIAVVWCWLNPSIREDFCEPDTTTEQDAIRGKWVRVRRNLNLEGGRTSGYLHIYYRRTRRQDVDMIANIKILGGKETPSSNPSKDRWHKVPTSLRSGIRGAGDTPLYLWYQTGKTLSQMSDDEKANLITEIDVLYGDDVPWYGFERLEPATMEKKGKVQSTYVTYRRGVKIPPRAPPLHFSRDGKFKIMQIADLHYSVSQGVCRDTLLSPCTGSDNLTNTLIGRMLDAEKPDLVVFSGDQLNGQGTTWDTKSVLAKFARAVTDRKIPWAAVFGNHDEDDGTPKSEQMALMKSLPYSLVEYGPKDIHGVGNYVLKVNSADASKTHLLTLYFMDSGSYSKGFLDWFGFFTPTEYDWIRQNQIDWFLQQSASHKPIERPFTPDDRKDFGHIWSRQDQITPSIRKLAKPNALAFFHMPLPETYDPPDFDPVTRKPLDVGISGQETDGNAKGNDGFFEKGILSALESDHTSRQSIPEVKVIANGHCHLTENCRRVKGVWFCFGGGGSYSGYGRVGFDRRFRIYEISDYGETIRTYKRTESDEIVDDMILVGRDAPAL
ncbi:phosphatase DCR2 [Coprinopsis cinerea AmutBmut pab1-1]|nr:phosphatase DCR2 [Coprinopsis cinerea AmutBmut pab1-1]